MGQHRDASRALGCSPGTAFSRIRCRDVGCPCLHGHTYVFVAVRVRVSDALVHVDRVHARVRMCVCVCFVRVCLLPITGSRVFLLSCASRHAVPLQLLA